MEPKYAGEPVYDEEDEPALGPVGSDELDGEPGGELDTVPIISIKLPGFKHPQAVINELRLKRIYEPAGPDDGYRILVDRLWPRGMTKETARLDSWAKDVAPSNALRKAFHHEQEKMADFRKAYRSELDQNPDAAVLAGFITEQIKKSNVTILFGARNKMENNAVVLKEWLDDRMERNLA
jgi:uncharacterized protein YeaO (DUF488 family)